MNPPQAPWKILGILAITQVISWGTVYYAFTILAPQIQHEFGWRSEIVFGAFSWSLLVAGIVATPAGMLLDRIGGRAVMGVGSFICGIGLLLLGTTQSLMHYFFAWTVLGVAMALVLYEAAFATINREFWQHARRGISTVTLFGGLASTLFWPLTLHLDHLAGWRNTYLLYGAAQLAVCLPLHALMVVGKQRAGTPHPAPAVTAKNYSLQEALHHPAFWKLAFAFAANSFIFAALSVHLIPILHRLGHSMTAAVFAATLIGPMQVIGRIGEMAFAKKVRPQTIGRICFSVLPAAFLALILFGEQQAAAAAFCVLYGLSNGTLTIVRGTVPQELFGRQNYGAISGALAGPSLLAKAAGPLVIAAIAQTGWSARWLLGLLLLAALLSLLCYLAAVAAPRKSVAVTLP